MHYILEPIGAVFSDRALLDLAQHFNARASEGYRLHSVFQVTQPAGCLGGKATVTYVAVFEKQDHQRP